MQTSKCPICNSDVVIDEEIYEGDIVECANCNSVLEITALHPTSLGVVEDNSKISMQEE